MKKNSLAEKNPELAKEWHPTLNGDLTPEDVTCGSGRKIWWVCKKGHEWDSKIADRSKGSGCPHCCNRRILVGYNDLATTHPEIAKHWHPTFNGDLTPIDVGIGSARRVWWQCNKHSEHHWETTVNNIQRARGCPICTHIKVLPGYNDLATINPELAKEWHPTLNGALTPFDVTCRSSKKVWWECRKGHEWEAPTSSRNKGRGCMKCNSERQTSFPEQAIYHYLKKLLPVEVESRASVCGVEVDVYIPSWSLGIEYDGLYFHSSAKSDERETKKNKILSFNSVQLIRIKEAPERTEDSDAIIYCVPDKRYNYLNQVITSLMERLSKSERIPILLDIDIERDRIEIIEQYIEREKIHSIAVKNPTLAAEWHPVKNGKITPEKVSFGSEKKVWWQCKEKHEWQASVVNRNLGSGCPYCSRLYIIKGETDLESFYPELAKEWHPTLNGHLTASDVASQSQKMAWWLCGRKHEWSAKICNRSNGNGCPFCAGQCVIEGSTDLATLKPEIAREWHPTLNGGLTPNQIMSNSSKKIWWQCSKHPTHEWKTAVNSRNKGGCPYCSNKKVMLGYNDLATTHPDIAKEWHPTLNGDLTPLDVVVGSGKTLWWRCAQSHEWQAKLVERRRGRGRCPECRKAKRTQNLSSSIKNDETTAP